MSQIVLPEIVAVGVYNAELAHTGVTTTKKRKTSMFEIELPVTVGGVSYIDAESQPVTKGLVICAKPGQLRYTRLPFTCYFVHMLLPEGELSRRLLELPSFIKIGDYARYEALFAEMCACYDTAVERDLLLLQSRLLELIYLLSECASITDFQGERSHKETIARVIAYIKENLTADLSLERVAAVASFSPIHFHNCFKRSTGKTLRAFVEEERLRHAVGLLIGTDKTLAEIAYECGFGSQSYFSYAFRRKMGMTPRAYADRINRKYER